MVRIINSYRYVCMDCEPVLIIMWIHANIVCVLCIIGTYMCVVYCMCLFMNIHLIINSLCNVYNNKLYKNQNIIHVHINTLICNKHLCILGGSHV